MVEEKMNRTFKATVFLAALAVALIAYIIFSEGAHDSDKAPTEWQPQLLFGENPPTCRRNGDNTDSFGW